MASEPTEDELRRLYLDWCSTQVARRFLELSGDEIWLLSNQAVSQPAEADSPPPSLGALERIPDYLELVRKTALVLARELNLPGFSDWRERYLDDPAYFASDILRR